MQDEYQDYNPLRDRLRLFHFLAGAGASPPPHSSKLGAYHVAGEAGGNPVALTTDDWWTGYFVDPNQRRVMALRLSCGWGYGHWEDSTCAAVGCAPMSCGPDCECDSPGCADELQRNHGHPDKEQPGD